jgi:hypothetical protein
VSTTSSSALSATIPPVVLEQRQDRAPYSTVYTRTKLSVPLKGVPFESSLSSFGFNLYLLVLGMVLGGAGAHGLAGLRTRTSRLGTILMTASTLSGFAVCSLCRSQTTRAGSSRTTSRTTSPPTGCTCLDCGHDPGPAISSRHLRLYRL